ncbi:MAG: TetR/AcrR family transcriptional regulator [Polyangiaceae bacterium]
MKAKARLGRSESQQQTKERLVATAERLFLRDGYNATSIDRVAEAAGFSKGAVYSNFANKDELCLAVLDALHAREVAAIATAFAAKRSMKGRLAAFEAWAEKMIGDEGWTRLEMEFAIHARKHAKLMRELASRDRAVRAGLSALVTAQRDGAERALDAEAVALALLSLGIGLGFQRMIDPEISVRVLTDVVRLLISSTAE